MSQGEDISDDTNRNNKRKREYSDSDDTNEMEPTHKRYYIQSHITLFHFIFKTQKAEECEMTDCCFVYFQTKNC